MSEYRREAEAISFDLDRGNLRGAHDRMMIDIRNGWDPRALCDEVNRIEQRHGGPLAVLEPGRFGPEVQFTRPAPPPPPYEGGYYHRPVNGGDVAAGVITGLAIGGILGAMTHHDRRFKR